MTEILVGVDGTAGGEDALAFAARLAADSGAGLRLATAYPYEEWPSRTAAHEYGEYLRQSAKADLDDVAARLEMPGVPRHAIADPSPARALQLLAEQTGASLIAVGSTHRGIVGRVLPGSTAERLLHGSPCPVAIVPHGHRDRVDAGVRTVGVGYDGSEESETGLAAAAAVARKVGARLRVVRVFDSAQVTTPNAVGGGYLALLPELEDMARSGLERQVSALDADLHAEAVFLKGAAGPALAAQCRDVDLMVVGSRGYGPLRAVLLGGVSHVLVRDAACPVIVLPRGAHGAVDTLFGRAEEAAAP